MTLIELKEWLAETFDECELIDMLEVNSYEIVEAFSEKVEDRQESLEEEKERFEDDSEDSEIQT